MRPAISTLLICAAFLDGCGIPVRPLGRQQVEEARLARKAIVLLRMGVDRKRADRLSASPAYRNIPANTTRSSKLSFELVALDTMPRPHYVLPAGSPSEDARQQGWSYFILDPGTYHLQFIPPHRPDLISLDGYRGRWSRAYGQEDPTFCTGEDPTFWFQVPENQPLLYVGSLAVSCRTKAGWPFGEVVDECSDIRLADESEMAKALGGGLNELGPMTSTLMRQYGAPNLQRDQVVPVRLVTAGAERLISPRWVTRSLARAALLGGGDTLRGSSVHLEPWSSWAGAGPGGGYLAAGLIALYGAYLAVALPSAAIAGTLSARKWQSCMDTLAAEVRTFDVATPWSAGLTQVAATGSPSGQVEPDVRTGNLLQSEILSIQLRECKERWTFCVEVTGRARLWDATSKTLLLDETLRYSTRGARAKASELQTPYELPLAVDSPCRRIENYCDAGGRQVFRDEISHAVQLMGKHLRDALALAPPKGSGPD